MCVRACNGGIARRHLRRVVGGRVRFILGALKSHSRRAQTPGPPRPARHLESIDIDARIRVRDILDLAQEGPGEVGAWAQHRRVRRARVLTLVVHDEVHALLIFKKDVLSMCARMHACVHVRVCVYAHI